MQPQHYEKKNATVHVSYQSVARPSFLPSFFPRPCLSNFSAEGLSKTICMSATNTWISEVHGHQDLKSFLFFLFILHFITVKQWIIDDLIKIKETYLAIAAFCISEVWTVCVDGLNFGVCCTWISSDSRIHQRQATPEDIHWCGRLNQIGPTNQHLMVWTACSFGVC